MKMLFCFVLALTYGKISLADQNCSLEGKQMDQALNLAGDLIYKSIVSDLQNLNLKLSKNPMATLLTPNADLPMNFNAVSFNLADGTNLNLGVVSQGSAFGELIVVSEYDVEGNIKNCQVSFPDVIVTDVINSNTNHQILSLNRTVPGQAVLSFGPNQ